MAGSLFDQLKKSGLVDEKKAKKIQREKQQQAKKQKANKSKKGTVEQSEASKLAQKAAAEKAKRDQELNQKRQQEQAQKARQAELKQIIESNRLTNFEGDISYHFADGEKVQNLHVNAKTQKGLANGQLQLVHFNQGYAIVRADAVEKIVQRDPNALVKGKSLETELSEEDKDYYAKFEIPDDLVW
ncbi:DUF2058 domain-containing protein [Thiomicrorhabdus indica]|uniref:DUF2058 domain-containing protein n=1 Tax=Thiomicrorhabdus indica TaxID=2267253 RepID=UPI00102D94AA|nr:DUF2058 domain-containing protein [Thiomicrorhabdus indica]